MENFSMVSLRQTVKQRHRCTIRLPRFKELRSLYHEQFCGRLWLNRGRGFVARFFPRTTVCGRTADASAFFTHFA